VQNIVIMCEKFHYDRLGNDRVLGNRKSDNNKNNVRSHWGSVSGSKKCRFRRIRCYFVKLLFLFAIIWYFAVDVMFFLLFGVFHLTFLVVYFVSYSVVIVHRYCAALPASPVAVGTVEVTATTVRLIWASGDSGPVDPSVSYCIAYRELNGSTATEREVSDILASEYRITGLSVYTTYLFRVVAVNNVGRGSPSSPLEVTTDQLGQYDHFCFFCYLFRSTFSMI